MKATCIIALGRMPPVGHNLFGHPAPMLCHGKHFDSALLVDVAAEFGKVNPQQERQGLHVQMQIRHEDQLSLG